MDLLPINSTIPVNMVSLFQYEVMIEEEMVELWCDFFL